MLDWWYDSQKRPDPQPWLLPLGQLERRAVPAHAERVAACRATKDLSYEDVIAATDKGIAIIGDGSFSIDQQRYNAQFGGQLFYEIKGGKIVGMLKDVAYQMRTPDFWNAMDMIGGKKSYEHGRELLRRKGTARSGQRGEPRLRAEPLPQHQRHQHGAESHERAQESVRQGEHALVGRQ